MIYPIGNRYLKWSLASKHAILEHDARALTATFTYLVSPEKTRVPVTRELEHRELCDFTDAALALAEKIDKFQDYFASSILTPAGDDLAQDAWRQLRAERQDFFADDPLQATDLTLDFTECADPQTRHEMIDALPFAYARTRLAETLNMLQNDGHVVDSLKIDIEPLEDYVRKKLSIFAVDTDRFYKTPDWIHRDSLLLKPS